MTQPLSPNSLVSTTAPGSVIASPGAISVTKETALKWANVYLKLGWSLVPISPDTKVPTIKWSIYQERQPTIEEVTKWINKGWYLAVVTGPISGVCVIDDDRIKHDLPEYGFSSPVSAITQSGGKHYYFKYDREIHTHVNPILHVDLKAWHSYCLLPPWKGRKWLSLDFTNLQSLPPETETLIRSDMTTADTGAEITSYQKLEVKDFIDIPEGSRTTALYEIACSIFNKMDFDTGKRVLAGVNETYHPPLTKQEFDYNCQRAWDYIQAHPVDDAKVDVNKIEHLRKSKTNGEMVAPVSEEEMNTKYPFLDNATFMSTNYPQPKWLIDKLIRIGGISFLVGEAGAGKTIASLTIAKAVSEGSMWLEKFQAEQMPVLILDKENTPADIQKFFKSMNIQNPNIFNFFTEEEYELIDPKAKLTKFANHIQRFIKLHNIGLVILDSAIDFIMGEENSSEQVAININKWKEICFPASILAIHHFKKANPQVKIKAADMMRGSSVWLSSAQSVLAFSVPDIANPKLLLVEHAKARGGAKSKPFEIEMQIIDNPQIKDSMVTGYKYLKEVTEVKLKSDLAKDAVKQFLYDHLDTGFTTKEITEALVGDELGQRNLFLAISQMANDGDIQTVSGTGVRGDPKVYKLCVTDVLENLEGECG